MSKSKTDSFKLGIVGSRSFSNRKLLEWVLHSLKFQPSVIVSGGARGADSLAENYAKSHGIKTKIFHPDWEEHGKAAGPIRNKKIVEYSDAIIAFWDGSSRGTASSIRLSRDKKVPLLIINFRKRYCLRYPFCE